MMKADDDMDDMDLSSQDSYELTHSSQQQKQQQQQYPSSNALGPKKRKYNEEERIRRW